MKQKRKGNAGELQVARMLHAWWEPFEPTVHDGNVLKFIRTPQSGGASYGPQFNMCGDITTNSQLFPFSVEVKRVERFSLERLFAGGTSPVWGFWRQCQRDARRVRREPMLWFRQNRKPWLVMMRKRYISSLVGVRAPDAVWPNRLRLTVDCEAIPVAYLSEILLQHEPKIFAMKP